MPRPRATGPRSASSLRRACATLAAVAGLGASLVVGAPPAAAAPSPCTDGSTPASMSTVTCASAGSYTLTVPAGTTDVDVDVIGGGGGAGYPARQHIGGHAAEVTGTLTLPANTAKLLVIVGVGGTGDNHGTSTGGGGSGVFALDGSNALLAKLVIAGGGGGGAYNGDGGNAGSAGTSDNAQAVSGPGQPGVGATGGAGGTGNYAPGTAGGSDNPFTTTIASGGNGGAVPGGATGGGGAGGYAGGGGGGGSRGSILSSNVAGGGGGSSLASSYLGSASISVLPGTGGVQLPGLVASDGATGSVVLTLNGAVAPDAPSGVSAVAGDGQASVSFTAPVSDGGSAITGYTVTSSPGAVSETCSVSPCVVSGLTNGTSYTFTVHATNAVGDSVESAASSSVVPTLPAPVPPVAPDAPTTPTAVAGNASVTVSWAASTDGNVTGYTVTANPGPATCSTSSPTATSCLLGDATGVTYTYTVVAHSAGSDSAASPASNPVTPLAPVVPASIPPAAPVTLTTTRGVLSQVSPDEQITVVGSGFLAFSSVTVLMYSEPTVLGTAVADADGNVQLTVVIPATIGAGAHDVAVSGVDAAGIDRFIRMPVTVAVAPSDAPAVDPGPSAPDALAFTGTSAFEGLVNAVLLAGAGALLVMMARRRERHS